MLQELKALPVQVLIESDWNLKEAAAPVFHSRWSVLIESDWNLKHYRLTHLLEEGHRINRIRLEFKVGEVTSAARSVAGINRIRLEFKVQVQCGGFYRGLGINRIRLEFKGEEDKLKYRKRVEY